MRFAAIAICAGLAGTLLASNLQGAVMLSGEGLPATVLQVDDIVTGSVATLPSGSPKEAMRLIDLRSGATCKVARPDPEARGFEPVPFGPDCMTSPDLSRIVLWRSTEAGSLIMADGGGSKVLEFAPGDGVLYESIFPETALITIVPAKG